LNINGAGFFPKYGAPESLSFRGAVRRNAVDERENGLSCSMSWGWMMKKGRFSRTLHILGSALRRCRKKIEK
jgi:hypothetical protein